MDAVIGFCHGLVRQVSGLQPFLLLGMRLWIASIFWKSGVLKIQDFDTAILLFTEEHPVPFLSPVIAAALGTFFELVCPVMLALGLGSRLATLPLLAMTAVIQFTYLDNIQHYYWAMLLITILIFGPGKWSADEWIWRKLMRP